MSWEYKREEQTFQPIPVGKHRIRVKSAEKAQSKSGNDMLALQFDVSGYNSTLYHYITFMKDKPEVTNRMLTQFFDSFKDIPEGEFDTSKWVGKVGACVVKHEEWNGNQNARISYFLASDKQTDLPAWKEPEGGGAVKADADGFVAFDSKEMDDIFG